MFQGGCEWFTGPIGVESCGGNLSVSYKEFEHNVVNIIIGQVIAVFIDIINTVLLHKFLYVVKRIFKECVSRFSVSFQSAKPVS